MRRIPEPELMDDPAQALAYAQADFSEPHDRFVDLFIERFGSEIRGKVLDLGCGPGDICRRFARALVGCRVEGLDASPAMLELALADTEAANLSQRVQFSCGHLPEAQLPVGHYEAVISNSLLHHLADPATLWRSVRRFAKAGAPVFVMDLIRPDSRATAARMVEQYAADEPALLRRDFFNSLLAAYRPDEVQRQLAQHGLRELHIETVSDRHLVVSGYLISAAASRSDGTAYR
jgi:cyclopropane fatty-acyl-phospholipid synthase-like methyltransferase